MFNKITKLISTVYQNYFELGAAVGAILIVCIAIIMDTYMYLNACPLCIMTRYLFIFIAIASIIGYLIKRAKVLTRLLTIFFAMLGLVVNSRQIYLQNLSEEEIAMLAPNCGMPLETQIEFFGFYAGIINAFQGGPTCAQDGWRFLLNFAEWAFVFFSIYIIASALKLFTSK